MVVKKITHPALKVKPSIVLPVTHTAYHFVNFQQYPPLEQVNSPTVPTIQASFYMNRKPQTLRIWACQENGPIRPIRVNGRLAWRVADIRRLMEGA